MCGEVRSHLSANLAARSSGVEGRGEDELDLAVLDDMRHHLTAAGLQSYKNNG